jgi:RNA polymerase sigma-70 factor, ECF subfamily
MGSTATEAQRFTRLLDSAVYEVAWRYACRLAQSHADAQDLLQDALAHAAVRLGQLRDDDAFRGWLLSIVRTRHLMAVRARSRMEQAGARLREESTTAAAWSIEAAPDPRGEALAAALRQLPLEQRQLLCLHYLDGVEARELAQVYGISRAALEQRLHRARLEVRRILALSEPARADLAPEEG